MKKGNVPDDEVTNQSKPGEWRLSEMAGNFLHRSARESSRSPRDSGPSQSSTHASIAGAGVGAVLLVGKEGTTFALLEQALASILSPNTTNGILEGSHNLILWYVI